MIGASAAMALKIVQIPLTRSPSSLSLSLSLSLANSLEAVKSVWSVRPSERSNTGAPLHAVKDAREKGKKREVR